MKKYFFLATILTIICSCTEPTLEKTVKSALESQLNQNITEVKIGDTVLAITLRERRRVIDSTLIEYSSNLKKLEATRTDLQISLKENRK